MKTILTILTLAVTLYSEPRRIFGWELGAPWSGPATFLSNQGIDVKVITTPPFMQGYLMTGSIIAVPLVKTTGIQVYQGKIFSLEFALNDPTEDTFDTVAETLRGQFSNVMKEEYIYASKSLMVGGKMGTRDVVVSLEWSRLDRTLDMRYIDYEIGTNVQAEVKKARRAKTQGM